MSNYSRFVILIAVILLCGCVASENPTQPVTQEGLNPLLTTQTPTAGMLSIPSSPTCTLTAADIPAETVTSSISGMTATPGVTTMPESPTPAVTPTLAPRAWRMAPVIPASVSQHMIEIYALGQSLGNNPHAFSKVGDCQSMPPDFLSDFDNGRYNLGDYTYLQPVVDYFSGSFGRYSRSSKDGLTASAALATLWNDWRDCNVQETPLECEYRLNRPSFSIISLGTNDANGLLPFEDTLRRVIDVTLEQGIVPILVTKADDAEGDWSINATIFRLAYEYQIPVWNFWLAVQPLPEHGLRSPEHLTYGEYTLPCDFSKVENMQYAFNMRNLTALQVLDVVWRAVTGQPASAFTPTPVTYLP